jgi:hypothetical protein
VAAQVVHADLNGDGVRAHVEAARAGTELVVRTSAYRRVLHLGVADQILRFVVSDVDRDGRADIVASTRRSGLRVWFNSGQGRFRARRARALPWHRELSRERPHRAAPSQADDDGVDATASTPVIGTRARPPSMLHGARWSLARVSISASSQFVRPRVPRGPPSRLTRA